MKFSFASNKLERQLSDAKTLTRSFGDRAKALKRRLGVLKQARNLADVPKGPPMRCHQLTGDRAGCYAVSVKENWRLEFEPDHQPVPLKSDGGVNEQEVTAIKFLGVVDYH